MATMDDPLSQTMQLSWPAAKGMDVHTYYLGELMVCNLTSKEIVY